MTQNDPKNVFEDIFKAQKILWLGGHKTGTTFLQGMLDSSSESLETVGAAYQNLDIFREKFTRPLLFKSHDERAAPASEFPIGPKTTILFDENLPGLVQDAIKPRVGLYPQMEERVSRMVDYLDYTPDHIFFGIRALHGFLPSLYCETLKSTPFKVFKDFIPNVAKSLDWYPFLVRITELFPGVPLTVYTAEELRGNERRLLSAMTGVPPEDFKVNEAQDRPGFSKKAIIQLRELSKEREVTRSDVHHMTRKFPKSEKYPSFSHFGPVVKERLQDRYMHDQERILADNRMTLLKFK